MNARMKTSPDFIGVQKSKPAMTWALVVGFCILTTLCVASEAFSQLGPPPSFLDGLTEMQFPELLGLDQITLPRALSIIPKTRKASKDFFQQYYLSYEGRPIKWTGSFNTCKAGTTAKSFRNATAMRLNYFRAMAGVPAELVLSTEYCNKAQKAALIMGANCNLTHDPPSSWDCYSAEGHDAAPMCCLWIGGYGWEAIHTYMWDPGSGNYTVGHRRWLLYPQTQTMGTGDIPKGANACAANALWVFDSNVWGERPPTRDPFVAWPPPGYVPYQVVFPRWSFSYPKADFSSATVLMVSGGKKVAIKLQPVLDGYGENTLVWIPSNLCDMDRWPRPSKDTLYTITIKKVKINGASRSFSYKVTVFDPSH